MAPRAISAQSDAGGAPVLPARGVQLTRPPASGARSTAKSGPPCLDCPLRLQSAFIPKSRTEIDFIQSVKVDHRSIPAGNEIIYMGQEDAELFTLFEGWAFRHQTLTDGRRQILNFLLPGDLVGFQASLMTAAQHSVEALTDVTVCVFSRRKAWSIFAQMPEVAFQLAWLGAREESLVDENFTSVGQRTAKGRMAALIISLYRRAEHLGLVTDNSFFFPLTRIMLSDALGLSLVHTIKTWSHLRRAGVFSFDKQRLTLLNPRLTARMADDFQREWRQRPIL
jgi:CRP-like cAMP-binding protein